MKTRLICCLLCCALCLCLCACGSKAEPETPTEPIASETPEASAEPSALPEPEPVASPEAAAEPKESAAPADKRPQRQSTLPGASLHTAEEPEPEDTLAALIADAQRFVDGPLEALIAELGEPLSREYVSSCLGSGQDGELRYEGFTVYTYLSDKGETVTGVE